MSSSHEEAAVEGAPSVSLALRQGTRTQHEEAEHEPFMRELMAGNRTSEAYADLAVQLHAVYSALETLGTRSRGSIAGPLVIPELERRGALESDLHAMLGSDWRRSASLVPATSTYVAHLTAPHATPLRYVANAYTRYLGDLAGGQVIGRMLERHYGFTPERLAFYRFEELGPIKPFRDRYRGLLDELPIGRAEQDALVAEARVAFELNQAIFRDLNARHPG